MQDCLREGASGALVYQRVTPAVCRRLSGGPACCTEDPRPEFESPLGWDPSRLESVPSAIRRALQARTPRCGACMPRVAESKTKWAVGTGVTWRPTKPSFENTESPFGVIKQRASAGITTQATRELRGKGTDAVRSGLGRDRYVGYVAARVLRVALGSIRIRLDNCADVALQLGDEVAPWTPLARRRPLRRDPPRPDRPPRLSVAREEERP